MDLGSGIRRLGSGLVNVYLVEEAGEVTVIEPGAPGYWDDLATELAAMGRSPADVRAILLTHAHTDHMGFAERARREWHIPVWVHELDAALARGEVKQASDPHAPGIRSMRLRPSLGFLLFGLRHGLMRVPRVTAVSTFGDGATLDVPGSPRVVLVPGHTDGSAALHVSARDALFVGDAIATRNVMSGAVGPQIAPFGADLRQAYESLARLDNLDARLVLPGHGTPWTEGIAAAVARIRSDAAAPSGARSPASAGAE